MGCCRAVHAPQRPRGTMVRRDRDGGLTEGEEAPMGQEPLGHEPDVAGPDTSFQVRPWASPTELPDPAVATPLAQPDLPAAPSARPTGSRPAPARRPLRPLSFGEIMDFSFGAFRRNPKVVLGLALPLVLFAEIITVALQFTLGNVPTQFGPADTDADATISLLSLVVSLGVSTVVGTALAALVSVVVAEDALGNQLTGWDAWRLVRRRLVPLILISLVTTALIVLGFVFLVVPGLFLWAGWAVIAPAMMLERLGPIQALRRSWQLTRYETGQVIGIQLVSWLLSLLINYILGLPFVILGAVLVSLSDDPDPSGLPLLWLAALGAVLGGIVARPFRAGVLALLYVDRRVRAEGLDLALALDARRARQQQPAAEQRPDVPVAALPPLPVADPQGAG
jgi:hypothetical protein